MISPTIAADSRGPGDSGHHAKMLTPRMEVADPTGCAAGRPAIARRG